jgi:two-component system, OmpR family, response regulator
LTEIARKKKVLLVEDDKAIQQLLAAMLQLEGYETFTADHGLRAIEILNKESVDIIVCDMMMPYMDGMSFIRWLREEKKMTLPVMVLTSVHDEKVREEIFKAGATDIVYKPVALTTLCEKLKSL